jgi:hypothetical protein
MKDASYRVALVLHEEYGERLIDLFAQMPVMVIDTPTNKSVVQKLWAFHSRRNQLISVAVHEGDTPFERCIRGVNCARYQFDGVLRTPYTEIEVFGMGLTDDLSRRLMECGFERFEVTEDGFVAFRRPKVYQSDAANAG